VYVSDSQAPKADIVNKRRLLGLLLFVTPKEPLFAQSTDVPEMTASGRHCTEHASQRGGYS